MFGVGGVWLVGGVCVFGRVGVCMYDGCVWLVGWVCDSMMGVCGWYDGRVLLV